MTTASGHSVMTARGWRTNSRDKSFKYRNANAASLAACIATLQAKAAARLAIFRWSVLNVLIGNADAHLKNLSFFSSSKGYQLAPFYDLVSTVVYNTPTYNETGEPWPGVELSMPMGDTRHFSDISRKNVLAFADELGLRAAGAATQLDRLLHDLGHHVALTRAHINEIAQPDAGEIRLLDSIERLPIAEMSRALR
ncbi:HipA domain-containing protein [Paraburkholderia sp. MMS20-SJTR3]|uniref:HipA domain-containing protein n=1 Tax=Paraburkholderia sejongensis TaxID=2886946 RepID=A0ABS8JPX2_9BURK|nr:HipA domain-containing protein [Paraburkholderia sp. MMS20-SJTR3]MCC8391768.1 HipA domain-containing protein [Paraburkholderia sp. MMS20-SJTR3]